MSFRFNKVNTDDLNIEIEEQTSLLGDKGKEAESLSTTPNTTNRNIDSETYQTNLTQTNLTQTNLTQTNPSTNPFDTPGYSKEAPKEDPQENSDEYQTFIPHFDVRNYKEPVRYHKAQWIAQAGLNFLFAVGPTYVFKDIYKPEGALADIMAMVSFPLNRVVNGAIETITFEEDPLSKLRALSGTNHAGLGFAKEATTRVATIGLVALTAYGTHILMKAYAHQMTESDNQALQNLAVALTKDEFKTLVYGTAGYLAVEGNYRLGMALWECCTTSKEEKLKDKQDLNIFQTTLGYGVRFFIDGAMTQFILYYLKAFGQEAIGGDPRVQIGIFLASDVATQLGRYFAWVPHPIDSLTPMNPTPTEYHTEEDAEERRVERMPTKCESRARVIGFGLLLTAGMCGGSYILNRVYCGLTDNYGSKVCTDDTLETRMIRYAASVALPWGIKYSAEHIGPAMKKGFTKCWTSFFPSSRAEDLDARNAQELTNTNNNTNVDTDRSAYRRSLR